MCPGAWQSTARLSGTAPAPKLAEEKSGEKKRRARTIKYAAALKADELEKLDARQGQIVELRFFGGLTIEEIAKLLKISPATVKREWSTAKLWLQHQLAEMQS